MENTLEEQILKGCGDEKVTAECEAKRAMLDNWANFCHIDKRNTQLERPEELELHYRNFEKMINFKHIFQLNLFKWMVSTSQISNFWKSICKQSK